MKRTKNRVIRLLYLFLTIFFLYLTAGVFHVWINSEKTQTGYALSGLKKEIVEIEENNRRLKLELAFLKSPEYLEGLAASEFGLRYPLSKQVVFLP